MTEKLLDGNQIHATLVVMGRAARRIRAGSTNPNLDALPRLIKCRNRLRIVAATSRPPDSSHNNTALSGNRPRTSSRYQRNTRSSPSSIGTHRGRGPDPLAPLPNRTCSLPNGPRRNPHPRAVEHHHLLRPQPGVIQRAEQRVITCGRRILAGGRDPPPRGTRRTRPPAPAPAAPARSASRR